MTPVGGNSVGFRPSGRALLPETCAASKHVQSLGVDGDAVCAFSARPIGTSPMVPKQART